MSFIRAMFFFAATSVATSAFAYGYYQPDEGGLAVTPEEAEPPNMWQAARSDPGAPLNVAVPGGTVVGSSEPRLSDRESVASRFINPRPEMGCMYYDENNNRHWWPHCREL